MATIAVTGNDAISINGRILADFADGDIGDLTFPNMIVDLKTGKNGNSVYAENKTGLQSEMKLRIIRGSADDIFLNNLIVQQLQGLASFPLMYGEFVKQIGDSLGNLQYDTYLVAGGVFTKVPEVKSNVEGNTDQSVTEWQFKFSSIVRAIT